MGEDLAVEQHVMSDRRRVLCQLRERTRRLFEVAREQLHSQCLAMELTAHAVVLLLGPDRARAHALEGLASRLDRAREHEPHGLEQRDRAGLEVAALASDRCFADVASDQVDALDLGNGYAERLRDRGLHEALAQADPHLTAEDLDEEPRRLGIEAAKQRLEWFRLRVATRGADGLERRFHLGE